MRRNEGWRREELSATSLTGLLCKGFAPLCPTSPPAASSVHSSAAEDKLSKSSSHSQNTHRDSLITKWCTSNENLCYGKANETHGKVLRYATTLSKALGLQLTGSHGAFTGAAAPSPRQPSSPRPPRPMKLTAPLILSFSCVVFQSVKMFICFLGN